MEIIKLDETELQSMISQMENFIIEVKSYFRRIEIEQQIKELKSEFNDVLGT